MNMNNWSRIVFCITMAMGCVACQNQNKGDLPYCDEDEHKEQTMENEDDNASSSLPEQKAAAPSS